MSEIESCHENWDGQQGGVHIMVGRSMRLITAMTLRDGGTTSITVSRGLFRKVSYTIDYSLPWDGRQRFVLRGTPFCNDASSRLEVRCEEETEIHKWLIDAARRKYGPSALQEFLSSRIENPGTGKWFYAMNFLNILQRERCQPDDAPNSCPPSQLSRSPETRTPDSQRTSSTGACG